MSDQKSRQSRNPPEKSPDYEYVHNFVRDGATGGNTAYGNMAGNTGMRTAQEPPESKPSD